MNKVERVYVVAKSGQPLMPTKRLGKVRRLLKSGKAKVFRYEPFTIQLLYETTEYTQDVTVGVDAGYQTVGFSATTKKEELISGELELLSGMSERLKERAMYRNNRRSRTRYRPPRFNNRRRAKGCLAPSIQHKLDSHIRLVDILTSILPVTEIIVEVAIEQPSRIHLLAGLVISKDTLQDSGIYENTFCIEIAASGGSLIARIAKKKRFFRFIILGTGKKIDLIAQPI